MPKVSYMGNGSTTEFNFDFPFYETTDIVVIKNTTTLTSGYTVVGTPAGSDANIPYTGGKVVFDVAPIATDSIVIARHLPLTRIVDYQPTAKINPTTLNQDMNYTIEVLKEFNDKFSDFDERYAELLDIESIETISAKIDTVTAQIVALGDISTLTNDVSNLKTTVTGHTTSIGTLDTRTSGMIDYVVASQAPTAENNYTWYRKYKSGWVEQGGTVSVAAVGANQVGTQTVTLPVAMVYDNNASYKAFITRTDDPGMTYAVTTRTGTRTSTTLQICYCTTAAVSGALGFDWEVKGIAA